MAKSKLPTPETLRQLLRYDPETGFLFWRPRDESWFSGGRAPTHSARNWNSRWANKRALAAKVNGYNHGAVLWHPVRAARAIWAIQTGAWPERLVDHINGVRDDDRWSNLRHVDVQTNARNRAKDHRNKSGHIGVQWMPHRKAWRATIFDGGTSVHIGVYENLSDAAAARLDAEKRLGFHPNHGRSSIVSLR